MTKLTQLENYPTGDCMRTVFACLLDKKCPTEVPNFMAEGESKFEENMENWLEVEGLSYIEIAYEDMVRAEMVPYGLCGAIGKSPRGEYDHIVVGMVKLREESDGLKYRDVHFVHDTSPHHDGGYIDGPIKCIGFLTRKLATPTAPLKKNDKPDPSKIPTCSECKQPFNGSPDPDVCLRCLESNL